MSKPFEWKAEYNIDGGEVDDDHRHLFDLANRVFAASDHDFAEVKAITKELYSYMAEHFGRERDLMKEIRYPLFDQHIMQHRAIIRKMNQLLRSSENLDRYLSCLREIMLDWVLKHIIEDDHQFGEYYELQHGRDAQSPAADADDAISDHWE